MSAQLKPAAVMLPAKTVAVAEGDGIGPEITRAVLRILAEADPGLAFQPLTVGLQAYLAGHSAGFDRRVTDAVAEHGVLLKGPITTPQGGGYKSVNVSLRKTFGLYANLRPCVAYHPFVATHHPGMDVVIVRENEEDTYAGIEHQQTDEVVQCLKLVSRPGCERIVRYAFEYARQHGRRKVTCMTKDNIMKLTDGLFHRVFDEIARDYPEIASDHMIIDIGTAKMAVDPRRFDVVVTPNLYGDILSDVAAEVAGSIGLAPSSNIGRHCAMFEAVHGSAPDIAGRDLANPSGLLLSAVMMLVHLGRAGAATAIHNAWLRTLEEGLHTADIFGPHSRRQVGTQAFAEAVVTRLGLRPRDIPAVDYPERTVSSAPVLLEAAAVSREKTLEGVDVFLHWDQAERNPDALGHRLQAIAGPDFRLALITNRGVKVYPSGLQQTTRTDHWRCRFQSVEGRRLTPSHIAALLLRMAEAGFEAIKTENLYAFDGVRGYSQAQGE